MPTRKGTSWEVDENTNEGKCATAFTGRRRLRERGLCSRGKEQGFGRDAVEKMNFFIFWVIGKDELFLGFLRCELNVQLVVLPLASGLQLHCSSSYSVVPGGGECSFKRRVRLMWLWMEEKQGKSSTVKATSQKRMQKRLRQRKQDRLG
ncbi:hypothetical protein PIB30_064833 [Stylosanthes scabra]|uniref:Uncharacterized protein n=1 Tax=Stylosanthes scabra TaxID=79078 RepID=A0ABU6QMG0_9FABA|nr:hypothetical protein [Stylosanthes scabra]